ncbi:hypothetical protein ABW20_dc0108958 [Dactylellina cionopaga]|nr:hypothetical protein ABW20_dc0108958 [Dactylellina cionopaga]
MPLRTRLSQATAWARPPRTGDDGEAGRTADEGWEDAGSQAESGGGKVPVGQSQAMATGRQDTPAIGSNL